MCYWRRGGGWPEVGRRKEDPFVVVEDEINGGGFGGKGREGNAKSMLV